MPTHMFKPVRLAFAVSLLAFSAHTAWAQWQWTDSSGRKVFSDTAPPAHIPDSAIQRRPGEARKAAVTNTAAAATPVSTAPFDKKAAELERKKKLAEEAEKAREKAEEQRAAQARADNCQRAQRGLASLNTDSRVSTLNAKGERVLMDEPMRNAEKARLQQIVQQSCRP